MKPLGVKNYGSIPHLLGSKKDQTDKYIHEGQHRICTEKARDRHDVVIITEKYDGSNVGACKVDDKIHALTRSGYLASTSPYKQHHKFHAFVNLYYDYFHSILNEGERICGEWLHQVHSLRYNIDDYRPFVPFDLFDSNNRRLPFNDFYNRVDPYFETARLIHQGRPLLIDVAMKALRKPHLHSVRCIDDPEGLVYRVERKGEVDFLAKYVRSDFVPGLHIIGKKEAEFIYNKLFQRNDP